MPPPVAFNSSIAKRLTMSYRFFLALMLSVIFIEQLQAAEQVIGDDGRQILLGDDGRWQYRSTDRFATTADGQRVRLKEDGSWEYTGQQAIAADQLVADQKLLAEQTVDITISNWVIESARSGLQKVKSRTTQTVFYLSVSRQSDAGDHPLTLSASDFSVSDSDERQYAVLSLSPASAVIGAGETLQLELRAEGSPMGWTTKSMSVTVNKDALASPVDMTLTKRLSSAKKLTVNGF
jgi:hypothetical protein